MITMNDVAQRAGVSRTTVSLVFNNRRPRGGGIPEITQQRVMSAAAFLGYRHNALARAVVHGKNLMLGFLAWDMEEEYIGRILGGALDEANAHGYTLKVLRLQNADVDRHAVERCLELRLGGVLTVNMCEESVIYLSREMQQQNVPVVFANNNFPQPLGTCVTSDDVQGSRLAVQHLVDLGHRRIAFIAGRHTMDSRQEGYREAMKEHGLEMPADYLRCGRWDAKITEQITRELLGQANRPTAIFCADERMAFGVQRAARSLGISLPDELSVVGFANLSFAELGDPPLTTIAQPFNEIGRVAVRHLIERITSIQDDSRETSSAPREVLLPVNLVIRESTAPAP